MNTYSSPWINQVNRQTSHQSYVGSTFFLTNCDEKYQILELRTRLWNYYEIIYGIEQMRQQGIFVEAQMHLPPNHFGYSRSTTIGKIINADSYLVYNRIAEIYYPSIYPKYPESWAFSPLDFTKLENDPSVNHIYTNSEIEIHTITPQF